MPMLLRRAQRLVGADFLALMKRLAPAGIDALQRVTGPPEKSWAAQTRGQANTPEPLVPTGQSKPNRRCAKPSGAR
ncbi:hypothetical protein DXO170_07040 [Xanthomonas oryzae pv. oryzae]|uniref:Uncharacterized protein n=1 Tax=Xanthomonas oryzae pv. oryzae TaxID=64187 RepID=A0A854CJ14_XANOO|nr:hypothetical protein AZ54_02765 [Xanthomonas oryzae pv. oryzae PXO86]ALZ70547.1 hypothetical protein APZ20_02525 [Xanthomonas oryzae pv. oryzae]AOS05214.1 hypothetical protein ATY43_02630 [Xanthomonas oryzae pv. oryzae]AOS09373.1 hypothetical protein ATY44_02550 [Xanthomonas oryzae pv. oryzae]AOS24906.1 hypothetical protein ATY47_20910 [Xanthomonas oryzae pv. oryzae]